MGFKPTPPKTRRTGALNIRIGTDLQDRIKATAIMAGLSQNEFVVQALEYALDQMEAPTPKPSAAAE